MTRVFHTVFLTLIDQADVFQYLTLISLLFATAIWLLSLVSCVSLNAVPLIVPNCATKFVLAIGETPDVMLLKVVPKVATGASQKKSRSDKFWIWSKGVLLVPITVTGPSTVPPLLFSLVK